MKHFMKRWLENMIVEKNAWKAAFDVISSLEKNGYEAVIVGGAVRDSMRNHPANDVDVATNALPEEVKAIFSHTADVGIAHGTVLVIHSLSPVEVTTYRTEGTYQDHRRPDEVHFVSSLAEDLKRRDFTINAMAMTGKQEIIDLFGGKEDLKNGIIRAVGEPVERFKEDALRMLRAIRFSAQLGFQIEESTFNAISKQAQDIHFIAKERIKAEFDKIFVSDYPKIAIENIHKSGLGEYLPGEYVQFNSWNNFQTSTAYEGWAFFCLLQPQQDIEILRTFKCSNDEKKRAKEIVDAYHFLIADGWTKRHYFEFSLESLESAFKFAKHLEKNLSHPQSLTEIRHLKEKLAIQKRTELAVTGHDLVKWSSQKSGPWLKETLERIITEILENRLTNNQEKIKKWFLNELNSER